jgi:RecB family exonuclease
MPGADPSQWFGSAEASTTDPLFPFDNPVELRPSGVETLAECPLRWALQNAGGQRAAGLPAQVGRIIHHIAEKFPHGPQEDMLTELDGLWPTLGLEDTWTNRRQRVTAELMVEQLALFVSHSTGEVKVEKEFTLERDGVILRGRVDRLEPLRSGDASAGQQVIDFKTGSPISQDEAESNPQLGIYQLAMNAQGAKLVYLKEPRSGGPATRDQKPLPSFDEPWVERLIESSRDSAHSSSFEAHPNKNCARCPIRFSCPARDEGRQLTS